MRQHHGSRATFAAAHVFFWSDVERTKDETVATNSLPAEDARTVFLRHHGRLLRLCTLLTGNADLGEDLVQEAFSRALARVTALPESDQYPYLRATASNLWKNRLRRLSLERRWHPAEVATEPLSTEERDAIWRAVVALPVRQRACVVLRFYEELTERETAEILGCSIGTVKSQTSRALARLREEMRDEDRG
jgi:RNA polymerase sigma-70 factor (sigma-E family)